MSEWASSRRESMALRYARLDLFPGTVQLKLSNKHITFQDLCLSIFNLHRNYWIHLVMPLQMNIKPLHFINLPILGVKVPNVIQKK